MACQFPFNLQMGRPRVLADGNFGSCAPLTLVDFPIALRVESHLEETVLGVVALAAAGADQVAAPGRALAVVVLGHGEGCAAAAGDQKHAVGVLGGLVRRASWGGSTRTEKRLRSG